MINQDWWWGWRGPQNWRWGELTQSQEDDWERYNKSFVALAGIEWTILMDAMEKARRFIDRNDFLEIRYEDLCSNPPGVFRDVIEFCDLEWSRDFEDSVERLALRNANYKWRKELTCDQQRIVTDVVQDVLKKYGY
jgi:hypothetical protein